MFDDRYFFLGWLKILSSPFRLDFKVWALPNCHRLYLVEAFPVFPTPVYNCPFSASYTCLPSPFVSEHINKKMFKQLCSWGKTVLFSMNWTSSLLWFKGLTQTSLPNWVAVDLIIYDKRNWFPTRHPLYHPSFVPAYSIFFLVLFLVLSQPYPHREHVSDSLAPPR